MAWRQSPVNFNHVGFCEKTLSPGLPTDRLAHEVALVDGLLAEVVAERAGDPLVTAIRAARPRRKTKAKGTTTIDKTAKSPDRSKDTEALLAALERVEDFFRYPSNLFGGRADCEMAFVLGKSKINK